MMIPRSFPVRPIVLANLFVLATVSVACAQGSGPDIKPELDPLKNYLGTWDSEFQILNDQTNQTPRTYKGTATGKWIVGGAFMEQSGINILNENSKPMEFKTLMAFNKETKNFDYYYFYSSGEVIKGVASWNEEKKTMTTVRREKNGQSVTITADFSKPNHESWTIVIKGSDGQVRMKIVGKNRKRLSK